MWGELANSLQSGNIYLMTILVLGFISCVVIFERLIMLQFVYNIEFSKFLNNLKKMISSRDYERAMSLCKSISRTSLPKIALHALEAVENDPTSVRGVIEEDTIEFLPRVEARIGILPALATLIMLIGILGTIDQLWWAFHSIDVLDTSKKQAAIATGIGASLNPTAMGILVCTILLTAHQFLKGIALSLVEEIQRGVAVLFNLLVPNEVSYMAAPMSMPQEAAVASAESATELAAQPQEESRVNEPVEDASVEDIKDEEEII